VWSPDSSGPHLAAARAGEEVFAQRGTPPILIVNATHDASTPYVWAQGLAAQFDGSVLLTREGDGHTSSLTSACAREHIDRYLISGETPPAGQNCTDSVVAVGM